MKTLFLIVCALAVSVLAVGCGSDAARSDASMDAGLDAPIDASMTDGGICDDPIPELAAELFPRCYQTTQQCMEQCRNPSGGDAGTGGDAGSVATVDACLQTCIRTDTFPTQTVNGVTIDCYSCLGYQSAYCFDTTGCHDQLANFRCCIEAMCPAGSARNCPNVACQQEAAGLWGCRAETCGVYNDPASDLCFSDTAPPDAG